ncbi:MAG: triphosphoribosyl-dephospho-CoA synthase [Alphaproteobacteria bacterium]
MTRSQTIAAAFCAACLAELQALKPGNVHIHAGGHGMMVADFEASAEVSAPNIAACGASVGERIFSAVKATRALAGQNTNLGIVLLCAPLAAAAEIMPPDGDLRTTLREVLAALTVEDAALCFKAIALAAPAGLGDAPEHNVHAAPTVSLLEAMRAAAQRDRIAWQYATDFADIFESGLPLAKAMAQAGADLADIAEHIYWRFLTSIPDSHIARKYGLPRAEEVRAQALALDARLAITAAEDKRRAFLLSFDTELKAAAINPGTTADLTVATLFVQSLGSNAG